MIDKLTGTTSAVDEHRGCHDRRYDEVECQIECSVLERANHKSWFRRLTLTIRGRPTYAQSAERRTEQSTVAPSATAPALDLCARSETPELLYTPNHVSNVIQSSAAATEATHGLVLGFNPPDDVRSETAVAVVGVVPPPVVPALPTVFVFTPLTVEPAPLEVVLCTGGGASPFTPYRLTIA
jgi:hypothetical protein